MFESTLITAKIHAKNFSYNILFQNYFRVCMYGIKFRVVSLETRYKFFSHQFLLSNTTLNENSYSKFNIFTFEQVIMLIVTR